MYTPSREAGEMDTARVDAQLALRKAKQRVVEADVLSVSVNVDVSTR